MVVIKVFRMPKLIITCALTGSATAPSQTPYLPITPDQIADEAYRAYEAGAAIVHVHVRDPETAMPTADLDIWRETLTKIKQKCDVVICVSTGGGAGMTAEERIATVPEFEPEMCSFNMGSMNFGMFPLAERIKEWKFPWEKAMVEMSKDFVFKNTFADLEVFAKTMREHNVKPECEVYCSSGLYNMGFLIRTGQLDLPVHIQYVLGVLGGAYSTPYELINLQTETHRMLGPDNYTWSVIGIGYPAEFRLGAVAMTMGGHVRVGLEDNIFIKRRVLAKSNAEFVQKARRIAEDLGREIATSDEARQMLDLKGINKVKF